MLVEEPRFNYSLVSRGLISLGRTAFKSSPQNLCTIAILIQLHITYMYPMYLINAKTLKLENFVGSPLEYVILSHTWGGDEFSYSDFWGTAKRVGQLGFRKIELTCIQA